MDIVEELRRDRDSGAKRLVSEYKAGLMSLARRFCVNECDAEELVNATFAKVVDNIDDYLEQSAFFAWMCQILTNLFRESVRRKSVKNEIFPGDMPEFEDESAQEEIFRNLDHSLLRDAIQSLPKEMKEVIVMHYLLEEPVARVAKFVGEPVSTVKWRLHVARKALGAKLGAAAKKPGGKALLLVLALACTAALGAAVYNLAVAGEAKDRGDAATVWTGETSEAASGWVEPSRRADANNASFVSPALSGDYCNPFPPPTTQKTPPTQEKTTMTATTLRTFAASAAFAAATAAMPASADIYVAKNGSDTNPGTSADAPKLTIQAGIDAAPDGSVVHVAPGIYDDFTTDATYGRACVIITNKVVTLAASGAKAETVILGRRQPGVDSGLGNDAVRCVVTSGAGGTVVSGFTLRNGSTKATARGGGYYDAGAKTDVTIVDCDFQGCAANWGGGAYGGTSVRCLFTGCLATGYGSVSVRGKHYNCAIVGNRLAGTCEYVIVYNEGMVNSTIAFNEGNPDKDPSKYYENCIVVGNSGSAVPTKLRNCATDTGATDNDCFAITADDLFSPATGDWRLKTSSAAIGAGNTTYMDGIPEAYRDTDLLGNPRMVNNTVSCGAVEASATPVATGVSFVSCEPRYGLLSVDGAVTGSAVPLPLRADALPAEPTVSFVPVDGYGMVALTNTVGNADIHWPLMDETVPLRIASATNLTYGPVSAEICHVAQNGDDTNGDGTEANPYATIAKGASGSASKLVLVHGGEYAPNPMSQWGNSRIVVTKTAPMRLKAVAGPSATAIVGASDSEGAQGLGSDAVRCAVLDGPVALQGFTLRGGRTVAPTASGSLAKESGGVLLRNNQSSVLDCVIEDCIGSFGSAANTVQPDIGLGHVVRCVIRNCSVANAVNYEGAVAGHVDLHSCLFYGNTLPSGATRSGVIGNGCEARFCTVVGTSSPLGAFYPTSRAWNCIMHGTTGGGDDLAWDTTTSSYNFYYGLFGTSTQDASNYATAVQGKPRFADVNAHDYRLQRNSAALAVGLLEFVTDRDLCDVTGRKFDFAASASGSCIAGCYSETVPAHVATVMTIR